MNDPLDQLGRRFTGLRLVSETGHGQIYAGQDSAGAEVSVAVLSPGAAADPAARDAFGDIVWRHSPGAVPEAAAVYAADLHAGRPWAAIRNPTGQPGAEQLLTELGQAVPAPPPAPPAAPPPTTLAGPPPTSLAGPPPTSLAGPPPTSLAGPPPTSLAQPPYSPAPSTPPPPGPPPTSLASAPASPAGYGYPSATGSPAYPGAGSPPGYPPAPPAYPSGGGFPPPGGGYPAAPARSRGPWPLLLGVGGAVLALVVLVGVGVIVAQNLGGDDDPPVITEPDPPPAPAPPPQPPAEPPAPPPPGDEPELRDVTEVSLIGPSFGDGDATYTMAFAGWPFAFRAPDDWNCLAADPDELPEGISLWSCFDPDGIGRVAVTFWECPAPCGAAEQRTAYEEWLDDPEDAVLQDDPPVAYVEYEENEEGEYALDISAFGGAGEDGLRWHVGIYASSPGETDDIHKVVNDILSQSA